jgi:hypothetical protein
MRPAPLSARGIDEYGCLPPNRGQHPLNSPLPGFLPALALAPSFGIDAQPLDTPDKRLDLRINEV